MTKTVVRILIMLFIALTFGCNEVTKPDEPINLEIAGVWQRIDISEIDQYPYTLTITNESYTIQNEYNYFIANISEFNNADHYIILCWTYNSEHIGKYQKMVWTSINDSEIEIQPYSICDTQSDAVSSTDIGGNSPFLLTHEGTCPAPILTSYSISATSAVRVYMYCALPSATIRYTVNGTEPNENSREYIDPIVLSASLTIRAKAFKTGNANSRIASQTYNVDVIVPDTEMILVEGGTFTMGTTNGTAYPPHQVTLSSFYLSKYEITDTEFNALMVGNGETRSYPVRHASWYDAIEYCNRRSILEGLTPCYSMNYYGSVPDSWPSGYQRDVSFQDNIIYHYTANGYRLPTEAEWEFAARGGIQSHNYQYSGSSNINQVAFYQGNSWGGSPTYVGTLQPNELGFYDMSGNVLEWVWDVFGEYSPYEEVNPMGPPYGIQRVKRGGSYNKPATDCTVYYRLPGIITYIAPYELGNTGFRICRNALASK